MYRAFSVLGHAFDEPETRGPAGGMHQRNTRQTPYQALRSDTRAETHAFVSC